MLDGPTSDRLLDMDLRGVTISGLVMCCLSDTNSNQQNTRACAAPRSNWQPPQAVWQSLRTVEQPTRRVPYFQRQIGRMGVCTSCLGGSRKEVFDEDEESRLLFDDPNGIHYGSFGDQSMSGQEDPVEVQRENEALQRVVAKTSDNMVDIFEIAPQDHAARPAPALFAYAGQEARIVRYQHLLSKLASKHEGEGTDWRRLGFGLAPARAGQLHSFPMLRCRSSHLSAVSVFCSALPCLINVATTIGWAAVQEERRVLGGLGGLRGRGFAVLLSCPEQVSMLRLTR
ncbi:hypothetical protein HYQ44_011662 [Verticillium longisporum]|nr:hypothetical protein HYQ44_011662 [Verticillium longisporum]